MPTPSHRDTRRQVSAVTAASLAYFTALGILALAPVIPLESTPAGTSDTARGDLEVFRTELATDPTTPIPPGLVAHTDSDGTRVYARGATGCWAFVIPTDGTPAPVHPANCPPT